MDAIAKSKKLVKEFFDGDVEKAELWFMTKNPLLGGMTPQGMISVCREDKLLAFILSQLAENKPPRVKVPPPEVCPLGLVKLPLLTVKEQRFLITKLKERPFSNKRVFRSGTYGQHQFQWNWQKAGHVFTTDDFCMLFPPFMLELISKIEARLAASGLPSWQCPSEHLHGLVNWYRPGHGLGWHVDDTCGFDDLVVGVSLGAPATLNFQKVGQAKHKYRLRIEPGEMMVMFGEARQKWEHRLDTTWADGLPVDVERMALTIRKLLHPPELPSIC